MPQKPSGGGLVVKVSPSASAYFAGEQFTAQITFTNTHPAPPSPSPSSFPPAPPPYSSHSRTTSTSLGKGRNRPPNASHLGLAEYSTNGLNSDEIPPSPFFGSTSGQFQPQSQTQTEPSSSSPNHSRNFSENNSPKRPNFTSNPLNRSISSSTSPSASPSTSKTTQQLPTRKGLIGKPPSLAPPPSSLPPRGPGGGLYSGGPRRPGGLLRSGSGSGHGRAQSMAISSSPDLLRKSSNESFEGRSMSTGYGHQKGRFGGSVMGGGGGNGVNGFAEERKISGSNRAPLPEEESASPTSPYESTTNFHEDAAFPISSSSSSPAPPSFPRRPTFGHQRVPSSSFYQNSRAGLSTLSLADSDSGDENEGNTSGNGFYGLGRNDTMDSVIEGSLNASYGRSSGKTGPLFEGLSGSNGVRPGHGRQRSISHGNHVEEEKIKNQFLHPPSTIALLWAFAHLEGSFEVDETLIKPNEFLEVKQLLAGGVGGVGMGGGTLERGKNEGKGGGWKNWLWGSSASEGKDRGGGKENESVSNGADAVGAASLEERKEKAVKDKSVPIFSCPPSILAVDLVLEPGESKTFSFSIRLPADLPPSFRGKAIKFNYQLVVGSNRVSVGSMGNQGMASGKGSVSRLMRVPLRIYNHVGVTGARPFYDLTNPVIYQRDKATITPIEEDAKALPTRRKPRISDVGRPEFESFASSLLSSIAISPELSQRPFPHLSASIGGRSSPRSIMDVRPEMRPEMNGHRGGGPEAFGIDLDEGNGCKSAVEIVSRNAQKVSYDINKDGYMVAQLTLVKSAYRLGETVNGSVMINSGEGRVLRVSARLETHELVETSISTKPAPQIRQITRRLHSEHHEATLDCARLGFALAIPSGATPDFGTSGVKLQWSVRLSFLVIPPSPDAPLDGSNPNITPRRAPLGRSAPLPPPPPSAPPNGRPGNHGRSKSFAYGFEPAVPLTLPAPPSIAPSGAAHLMPVSTPSLSPFASSFEPSKPAQYTSYRAVPDLGFVPVLFSSSLPDPPPSPGPLQKTAAGAMHRPNAPSMSLSASQRGDPLGGGRTVLVPAKVETVECSIPIKVYPGNTPFKPTVSIFEA